MRNWLETWIETESVTSPDRLDRALDDKQARQRLWDMADEVPYTTEPLPPLSGQAILAGKAMDLSGEFDACVAWDCRQWDIEKLFNKVWHYFDHIVIVGPSAQVIRHAREIDNEDWALAKIRADAQLLFYLRDIGAQDMILFREKPPACLWEHFKENARHVGIKKIEKLVEAEARRLLPDVHITELREHGDHWHYTMQHESLEHTRWGIVSSESNSEDIKLAVCRDVAHDFGAYLTSDIWSAQILKLPLGSTARLYSHMLSRIPTRLKATTGENVAFDLDLPVLQGITPKDLLAFRRDERESFEKFRFALREAINERLSCEANSRHVASEIQQDVLNPALNEISLRMRKTEEAFRRKSRISIGLGSLSVVCGLLGEAALATTFVAATTASAVAAEVKMIEEQRGISEEGMYFLWKVTNLK